MRVQAVVCVLLLCAGLTIRGDNSARFAVRLSVMPINAGSVSRIAGSGTVTATLVGSTLTIAGTFEGLLSPATVARLHQAPKGVRGPAVFDLAISKAPKGTLSGSLTLTPIQIDRLRKEQFYVQIHSETAPEGNLWGWLLRQESQ